MTQNKFKRSKDLTLPSIHSFNTELACELGSADLAILLQHFIYWVNFNKDQKKNYQQGYHWTYQTLDNLCTHFKYWTKRHIRTLLDKLIQKGILMKNNFNKNRFNKTAWYTVNSKNVCDVSKTADRCVTSGTSIYDKDTKTTDTKLKEKETNKGKESSEISFPDGPRKEEYETLKAYIESNDIPIRPHILLRWFNKWDSELVAFHFNMLVQQKSVRNPESWMEEALKRNYRKVQENVMLNRTFAVQFKEKKHWNGLVVLNKYCKMPFSGNEVHYMIDPETFKDAITNYYQNYQ